MVQGPALPGCSPPQGAEVGDCCSQRCSPSRLDCSPLRPRLPPAHPGAARQLSPLHALPTGGAGWSPGSWKCSPAQLTLRCVEASSQVL